jgi:hypothetical protein
VVSVFLILMSITTDGWGQRFDYFLCPTDYIGNTVVQKLFERCSEDTKLKMLRNIAPHLATIGVHKNGTWAAQKIIDTATRDDQMKLICEHILCGPVLSSSEHRPQPIYF